MYVGIDLALRKTGIVHLNRDGSLHQFSIIFSDPKKINDEELLSYNKMTLSLRLPFGLKKQDVALEGLSFNSVSADHDLISANHWITRLTLRKNTQITTHVFPPKAWQKTIVTKEWLAKLKETYPIIRAKKKMKLTKEETAANSKSKLAIRKASKQLILDSIPPDIIARFEAYVVKEKLPKDSIYDLADAYCLAQHLKKTLEK